MSEDTRKLLVVVKECRRLQNEIATVQSSLDSKQQEIAKLELDLQFEKSFRAQVESRLGMINATDEGLHDALAGLEKEGDNWKELTFKLQDQNAQLASEISARKEVIEHLISQLENMKVPDADDDEHDTTTPSTPSSIFFSVDDFLAIPKNFGDTISQPIRNFSDAIPNPATLVSKIPGTAMFQKIRMPFTSTTATPPSTTTTNRSDPNAPSHTDTLPVVNVHEHEQHYVESSRPGWADSEKWLSFKPQHLWRRSRADDPFGPTSVPLVQYAGEPGPNQNEVDIAPVSTTGRSFRLRFEESPRAGVRLWPLASERRSSANSGAADALPTHSQTSC
eukprot:c17567_g1_i1.p1 GENE.c17567_g1_i1~~c17567_g1_i1.p1  ORF type:complete len:335 (-),score=69.51 c17567_g1_i1:21-1025(-)